MGKLKTEIERLPKSVKDQLLQLMHSFPAELEQSVILRKYPASHTLLMVGDHAEKVYLLLKGRVRGVYEQANGAMYAFACFNAPYFFGEFEAFADCDRYRSTLICESDCLMALMPRDIYLAWVRSDPEVLFKRTRQITRSLMKQARSERNYLFYSGFERLLTFFTTQYREHNQEGICRLRVTYQEIADNIGFSVKTVQRGLKRMRQEELITQQGRVLEFNQAQYQHMLSLNIPEINKDVELQTFIEGE